MQHDRWIRASWVLTGALALSWPAAAQDAYDYVDQGNALYRDGVYAAAAEKYRRAAEALPESAEIHFNLANSLLKAFQYVDAEEHYSQALRMTRDPWLESRIKFNLGILKYEQARNAMQTFRDARPMVDAALTYYRNSLAIDPDHPDARFNLELAHYMLRQLRKQKAQETERGESKEQDTSRTKAQSFQRGAPQNRTRDEGSEQDDNQKAQGQEAQQAPQQQVATQNTSQTDQAASPQEMSPDVAEEMVTLMQQRARAAKEQRRQWRRARMRDGGIEKYW